MSEDWSQSTLGDVSKIKAGKYLAKEDYVDDGPFWIYGSNSIMGRYDRCLVESPHVVMAAVGANAGRVRYSHEPSWINNNAFALVPSSRVDAYFLFLWLSAVLDLRLVLAGTGQPYVKRPSLLAQEIALPPLETQRRIVDLMMCLEEHIANLEIEHESLVRLRASLVDHYLGDDSRSATQAEWMKTSLGKVAHIQQGKTLAVKNMTGGGHPVFGANGVIGYYDRGTYDFECVALGCRGSCGTVHVAPPGSYLANNVMAVWPRDSTTCSVAFLAVVLEHADLAGTGVITGQVQPQITRASLEGLPIAIPPLSVQKEITAVISEVDRSLTSLHEECAALKEVSRQMARNLADGTVPISGPTAELQVARP